METKKLEEYADIAADEYAELVKVHDEDRASKMQFLEAEEASGFKRKVKTKTQAGIDFSAKPTFMSKSKSTAPGITDKDLDGDDVKTESSGFQIGDMTQARGTADVEVREQR